MRIFLLKKSEICLHWDLAAYRLSLVYFHRKFQHFFTVEHLVLLCQKIKIKVMLKVIATSDLKIRFLVM